MIIKNVQNMQLKIHDNKVIGIHQKNVKKIQLECTK